MDLQQIKYFITAARCLNFSKAADQLYITQPALSRQITSIEKELNIQLFIRIGHELKLTPAAKVLYSEFSKLHEHYETSVERANTAQHALTGRLSIGVLDGARVDDIFANMLTDFERNYSEVELVLSYMNLNELISSLYDGGLDIAFTLFFEVENRRYIEYKTIAESKDLIAMHGTHPLAEKDRVGLGELENETFICVDTNVSEMSSALILEGFRKHGFRPNIRYSPSLYTSALLVQSGLGITMFDTRSIFRFVPGIKFLDTDQVRNPSLVAAWHRDNTNPAFATFKKLLLKG
ncbi:MAG: LysR family transcriptional regulator [Clostridiales Family XIII bacterium]|jgi:DNA-binding transcriptional LysR family regulator|nr:LysR family transcriptional regulator [Clostridiales Family XIII bacterium]